MLHLILPGFVPGVLFYITLFYKRSEHSFRIAIFLSFNILAGAIGGLLAAGISHLSGKLGVKGWQWIFILEAIPTVLLAVFTWLVLTPSPEEVRFLTPEERIYAVNRVLMDTNIHPSPQASWKETKAALTDVKIYLICLCQIFLHLAHSGMTLFLPTLIFELGFKATTAQLLTTPPYLVTAVISLLIPWWSDRINVRGWFVILVPTIAVLGFLLLALSSLIWLKYLAVTLALCGMVPTGVVLTSWLTNNFIEHTKRATALAMGVSFGGLASMAGTQVYRADDAPRFGSIMLLILTTTLLRTMLAREN
ncbi:hypothetical protein BGZ54_006984 [Gamsiella multidivaricata]|nr:hypothetical protein BGZ54_006984 [Gamsiella multidivaricata]